MEKITDEKEKRGEWGRGNKLSPNKFGFNFYGKATASSSWATTTATTATTTTVSAKTTIQYQIAIACIVAASIKNQEGKEEEEENKKQQQMQTASICRRSKAEPTAYFMNVSWDAQAVTYIHIMNLSAWASVCVRSCTSIFLWINWTGIYDAASHVHICMLAG